MKHFLVSKVAQKCLKFVWHSSPLQKNPSSHIKRTENVIYKVSLIINYGNTSGLIVPEYLVRNVVDSFHAFLSGRLYWEKEKKTKQNKNTVFHHSFPTFSRLQVPDVITKINIYGFNETHELN